MGRALSDYETEEYTRAEKLFKEVINLAKTDPLALQIKLRVEAYYKPGRIYWRSEKFRIESAEMSLHAFHTHEIAHGPEDPRTIAIGHDLCRTYFSMSEWFKCETALLQGHRSLRSDIWVRQHAH